MMTISLCRARRLAAYFFIFSAISLDLSIFQGDVKFSNFLVLLACLIAIAINCFSFLKKKERFFNFGFSDIPYLFYLLLCFISFQWSPNFFNTVFHSSLLLFIWLAIHSLSKVDLVYVLRFFINLGVFLCLLSILLIFISPDLAWQPGPSTERGELRGVFGHQLRLGVFCCILLGVIYFLRFYDSGFYIYKNMYVLSFIYLFVFAVLLAAFARLYTFFALASFIFAFFTPKKNFLNIIYSITIMFSFLLFILSWEHIILFLEIIGQDPTLTGRTTIWEKSINTASFQHIFGYGYPSFDDKIFDWDWRNYRPAHPHNSFIQAYFELGIIGLFTVLLFVLFNYYEVFKSSQIPFGALLVYLFWFNLFGSLTGANYSSKPTFLFVFLMFFLVSLRSSPNRFR